MKRAILIVGAVLLCIGIRHGLAASSAGSSAATVEIKSFAFAPQEITVSPGASVTWVNHDETAHSVASTSGKFSSQGLDSDDHYTFTFEQDGDYAYVCSLHPHMVGVVHVRAR
jgi:plastocyanin